MYLNIRRLHLLLDLRIIRVYSYSYMVGPEFLHTIFERTDPSTANTGYTTEVKAYLTEIRHPTG